MTTLRVSTLSVEELIATTALYVAANSMIKACFSWPAKGILSWLIEEILPPISG
jgi:hypothetical protein